MKTELSNAFGTVFLTIEYDAKNNWIYNNWIGYQTTESIIKGGEAFLEFLEETKCPYLLNDNQQVVGPWDHGIDWITNEWKPRALASGLTHFAHVVSPDSLSANSAEIMKDNLDHFMTIAIFGTMEEAVAWLKEMQTNVSKTGDSKD
jgi:hypothetical protein